MSNRDPDFDIYDAEPEGFEAIARTLEHYADSLPDHLIEEFQAAIAKATKP